MTNSILIIEQFPFKLILNKTNKQKLLDRYLDKT